MFSDTFPYLRALIAAGRYEAAWAEVDWLEDRLRYLPDPEPARSQLLSLIQPLLGASTR